VIFSKKEQVDGKNRGTRPVCGDKADFSISFWSFDLFVVGEGRRRVCGLPQSLWRWLKFKQPSSSPSSIFKWING
jgi:hypothetical protein